MDEMIITSAQYVASEDSGPKELVFKPDIDIFSGSISLLLPPPQDEIAIMDRIKKNKVLECGLII